MSTRTVTSPGRRLRRSATLGLAALGLALLPASALAHGGIVPQPVVDSVPGGLDGLVATGTVGFSPRIRVTNPDTEPLVVVDDTGRPWLRLGADGVWADLSTRAWYASLDATGRGQEPPAEAPDGWTRVSAGSTWEWHDRDLLPRTVDDDGHVWSIPVVVDGRFDQITGRLEESELQGRWTTTLVGDGAVGAAMVTAVSGPVPAFVLQQLAAEEVVVLGRDDEPMLRLSSDGWEVNAASPTWGEHARIDPAAEVGLAVEDAEAEPSWVLRAADAPTATWLEPRGSTWTVVPASRGATELPFTVPVVVDGERYDLAAVTSWVGDEVPLLPFRLTLPVLLAVSVGAGLLAAGVVHLRERRPGAPDVPSTVDRASGEAS